MKGNRRFDLEKGKVSVVTAAYNAAKFIEATILSVLNQKYENWEMLIVDDASTDNTSSIVKRWVKKDKRIFLIQLSRNRGQGVARNEAIRRASGQFIAFLDSDDIWHQDKLAIQVREMNRHNYSFSHTSYGYIDGKGSIIKEPQIVSDKPVTYKHLLKYTEISCLTAVYDAMILGKIYMPDIRRSQDYVLWLSLLKKTNSLPIKSVLAFYRLHDSNISKNKFKKNIDALESSEEV
jgi:teichuronic acid biosynthesis glycosyltransferase TuaG